MFFKEAIPAQNHVKRDGPSNILIQSRSKVNFPDLI